MQAELDFAPGTDYSYSNSGYSLLATIIEKATGNQFTDFLADELFEPAGMNRTGHLTLGDPWIDGPASFAE